MNFKTVKEAEIYVKEYLGYENIDFGNLNVIVASKLVRAIEVMFSKYPILKENINAIGTAKFVSAITTEELASGRIIEKGNTTTAQILASIMNDGPVRVSSFRRHTSDDGQFLALEFSKDFEEATPEQIMDFIKKFSDRDITKQVDFETLIYHEFYHLLDYVLKITSDFNNINEDTRKIINTSLPERGMFTQYYYEFFAYAFAEGMLNDDSSDLAKSVVALVDTVYQDKYRRGFGKKE